MDSVTLLESLDNVDADLESLEAVLKPILDDSLHSATRKLPILDRAKLNVTVVYAIESLLFSYLKINGVDPKDHPVWKELARVKQYFSKVKEAEEKHTKPAMTLNKQAAARMIQHSLAGNGNADMAKRAEELKKLIIAKKLRKVSTASPVSASIDASPSTPALPVTPLEAAQTAELLASVAKEIEKQDQEGSEEGEIDETPKMQHPLPSRPSLDLTQDQASLKKRKHPDFQTNGSTSLSKSEKKARKKVKKDARNTG
ncbi:hypothetical protein LTS08_000063 [Lithohypha guttulata]|nr:hypothetical protein LTS08_000063 [Lithohypha guttulata]